MANFSTFNVLDFGAIANDSSDDTQAIQKALDAAKKAGGGRVYLPAGKYYLSGTGDASDGAIRVHSNTELFGDGMGKTELKLVDGYRHKITGMVRTPVNQITENVVIRDLTLNGNNTGEVDGIMTGVLPGSAAFDRNILIERVEIHSVTRIAFNPHEQTRNLTIRDSVAHHNGWDGFIADFVSDAVYENNLAYANGRHGFNIVTHSQDVILRNNISHSNQEAGIVVQRGNGSPDSPDVGDYETSANERILVENNSVYKNGEQGVLLKMTRDSQVIGNQIYENGGEGIQLEGAFANLISNNTITDHPEGGILTKSYSGSITGPRASHHNRYFNNVVSGSDEAIAEKGSTTQANLYIGNQVDGNFQPSDRIGLNPQSKWQTGGETPSFTKLADSRTVLPEAIAIYSQSSPDGKPQGDSDPLDLNPANGDILFVAGSAQLAGGDIRLRDTLEQQGYTVTVRADDQLSPGDWADRDLVMISKSVSSAVMGNSLAELTQAAVPVMTWKPTLYDDLGMAQAMGYADNQTKIRVVGGDRLMPRQAPGTVEVYEQPRKVVWGQPGAEAITLATVDGDPKRAAIFAYDTGSQLTHGAIAPEKRVGFFLDYTSHVNEQALDLFEATVDWATA
ncbi:MAG: glycosyl hydrolase family 28-related protein [Synechococcales bacterium]|nr:glycosyl hydrolase family 28-related protein [Synechococcales bacterium]